MKALKVLKKAGATGAVWYDDGYQWEVRAAGVSMAKGYALGPQRAEKCVRDFLIAWATRMEKAHEELKRDQAEEIERIRKSGGSLHKRLAQYSSFDQCVRENQGKADPDAYAAAILQQSEAEVKKACGPNKKHPKKKGEKPTSPNRMTRAVKVLDLACSEMTRLARTAKVFKSRHAAALIRSCANAAKAVKGFARGQRDGGSMHKVLSAVVSRAKALVTALDDDPMQKGASTARLRASVTALGKTATRFRGALGIQ